jgi:aconitate hydratase
MAFGGERHSNRAAVASRRTCGRCGILPLQFQPGVNAEVLGLDGTELIDIAGLAQHAKVGGEITASIRKTNGQVLMVPLTVRLDTQEDVEYWRHGGIMPRVWREYVNGASEEHVAHDAKPLQPEVGGPQHELPDALPASDVPSASQGATLR